MLIQACFLLVTGNVGHYFIDARNPVSSVSVGINSYRCDAKPRVFLIANGQFYTAVDWDKKDLDR